jgi:NAD(P)-dependent dehydrogenase (short-subunit alcohol dehydrogenase family)
MQVRGCVVIVTGGSSGLGEATVRQLHAGGARVLIADVARERGAALAAELGDGARFYHTDVTNEEQVLAAVQGAKQAFGAVNVLVNCAGIAPGERVLGKGGVHRLDTFGRCITINLIGTFNTVRLAAAAMAQEAPNSEGERGIIINTASIAAFEGQIGQAAYSASKAGIVGMTLPIARELARQGIRVVTVAPGLFATPMMGGMSSEVQDSLKQLTPFPPRLGRPEEYAALVQHIIENVMFNGNCVRLDGAVRLSAK